MLFHEDIHIPDNFNMRGSVHLVGIYLAIAQLICAVFAIENHIRGTVLDTSCTPGALEHPAGFHCGSSGKHLEHPSVLSQSKTDNFDACRDSCLENRSCISFRYPTAGGKGICQTYTKALIDMGFQSSLNSGLSFYNRHCFVVCSYITSTVTVTPFTTTLTSTVVATPTTITDSTTVTTIVSTEATTSTTSTSTSTTTSIVPTSAGFLPVNDTQNGYPSNDKRNKIQQELGLSLNEWSKLQRDGSAHGTKLEGRAIAIHSTGTTIFTATVTANATTTVTTTMTVEATLTSSTTTTTTTTIDTIATATQTATSYAACNSQYFLGPIVPNGTVYDGSSGNGGFTGGNGNSAEDCCASCLNTTNCGGFFWGVPGSSNPTCNLLVMQSCQSQSAGGGAIYDATTGDTGGYEYVVGNGPCNYLVQTVTGGD